MLLEAVVELSRLSEVRVWRLEMLARMQGASRGEVSRIPKRPTQTMLQAQQHPILSH